MHCNEGGDSRITLPLFLLQINELGGAPSPPITIQCIIIIIWYCKLTYGFAPWYLPPQIHYIVITIGGPYYNTFNF